MAHPFSNRPTFEGLNDELFGFGIGASLESTATSRIVEYVHGLGGERNTDGSLWSEYRGFYDGPLSILERGDATEIDRLINDLFGSPLTHGFAQGHIVTHGLRNSLGSRMHVGATTLDRFYRLAEAVGALRVCSAEHGQVTIKISDIDGIMGRIEDAVGADLPSTRQCGSLFGLRIRGAIYSERHFDAIYAAWRARQLARETPESNYSLLEIGGGAGFLAFYARKLGFHRVAIIDLPHPLLSQYMVLVSELGPDHVSFGNAIANGVGLLTAGTKVAASFEGWSIVVNVDSLPEMLPTAARSYLACINAGQVLLSINQESAVDNGAYPQNVVAELARAVSLVRRSRFPAWLRTGYVEEVYTRET
jgi:hypothetical protein